MRIMRSIKILTMAILCCTALNLASCSGEDGERGPQGPSGEKGANGTSGVDGQDGANGEDGVDGHANVYSFKLDMAEWPGGQTFVFDMPIGAEDRANHDFLFYLEYVPNQIVLLHPVPGAALNEPFVVDISYTNEEASPSGVLLFMDHQGANFVVPPGFYLNLVIVAIQKENTMEGKNNTTDVMTKLKEAGVDTDDYNAVAAYFGLD